MDSRQHAIETTDFDLGACYLMFTDRHPTIFRQPGNNLTTVEMLDDAATRNLMMQYAAGTLMVNVKRFAACRAWIYRQAKAVK
jgi:hypothetical protein